MISRGVDGTIIDWYGPADFTDQTAKLVMAEVEQHPGFTFAIMVDKGAIGNSPCQGCTPQQTLVSLVHYVEQTYIPSPAYMRVNGQPLITNFDMDLNYTVDWAAVKAASTTNPDFIFQHKGGFTHAVSGGSYSWVIVNVTDEGMGYLSQFYGAGMAAPAEETIGAAYKGFNDTLASWGEGRIMNQQCGQTWLQTFNKINSLYNSTNQLDAVQLVTWDDYEEGTEIETGIDNCVSLSASLAGSVLNWHITGNENTIDHYVVYISADGNNLMPLDDLAPGSSSLDLCSYSLAPGSYSAYVQAIGKPTLRNQISGRIQYTAQCGGAGSAGGSGSSGGSGGSGSSGSGALTLSATPSAMSFQWRHSGTAQVVVNGSLQDTLSLSPCGNQQRDLKPHGHNNVRISRFKPGEWKNRNVVRIFLPHLWSRGIINFRKSVHPQEIVEACDPVFSGDVNRLIYLLRRRNNHASQPESCAFIYHYNQRIIW